jgi:hypothetical protein
MFSIIALQLLLQITTHCKISPLEQWGHGAWAAFHLMLIQKECCNKQPWYGKEVAESHWFFSLSMLIVYLFVEADQTPQTIWLFYF